MTDDAHPAMVTEASNQAAVFLAQLTHDFASSLDIVETLKHAIDRFMVHLNAEAASIFLLEEGGTALVCRECAGPVDIRGLRLASDQGIVGQTVQYNAAKIVRDVSRDPSFAAMVDADTGFATRSILCAPLSVRGTCLGALELLNKRGGDGLFDVNDMQLATTVASAAALAIHNAQLATALVEQERVRKELELARHIQESLLPGRESTAFPVHGLNIPAREVSGDFYDFLRLADGRIYFTLADVSGKGMNAALLMAKTTSLLRCLAKTASGAGALLRQVNDELCETATRGMFVTIVAGFLDRDRRRVDLANAGHHPVLLRRRDGGFEEFKASAPPLGVLADIDFPSRDLDLEGGVLYLYTDGMSESIDSNGAELGTAGLLRMIEAQVAVAADVRLSAIVETWRAAGCQSYDDITLLMIDPGRSGTHDQAPAMASGQPPAPVRQLLELSFPAAATSLQMVREQVQAAIAVIGASKKVISDLVIAVNEACMNIIKHAYKGDSSGEIVLQIMNNDAQLEVVLTDFAQPIDFAGIRPRALDELRPGGLGTHFMNEIMDECAYAHLPDQSGNVLRMIKRLDA